MINPRYFIKSIIISTTLVPALFSQSVFANGDTNDVFNTDYYRVIDNKVDPATFIGWRVYHNVCVECHGVGGSGTGVAPDLTQSVKQLTPEEFRIKV